MSKKRRQFDRAFKVEAVRLVTEEHRPVAAVARDLGIGENLLHRWKQQFTDQQESAFVGTGHLSAEQMELRRLRVENADLREERDILKKAISVFSDRKR
jgi:transposase